MPFKYLELRGPSSDDLRLRSLALTQETDTIIGIKTEFVEIQDMKMMYNRFKFLKVLDLNSIRSEGMPSEIGDLVLLKFLGLMDSINRYKPLVIPQSIGKLRKLQTLCGALHCAYEFPREMCELKELRHLKIFREPAGGSLNIGSHQMKLETLRYVLYAEWIHIDTVNLRNLSTLFIMVQVKSTYQCTLDSVANLTNLQSFFLDICDRTTAFPTIKPLSSCKHLKRVELSGTMTDESNLSYLPDSVTILRLVSSNFTQDPMHTLGSLSNLTVLHLESTESVGKKLVFRHDEFPSLQYFSLSDIYTLRELRVEEGVLPSLKGFMIERCQRLKKISKRLKRLPPIPDIFICN